MARLSERLQFFEGIGGSSLVDAIRESAILFQAASDKHQRDKSPADMQWRGVGTVETHYAIDRGLRFRCEQGWIQIQWLAADCIHVQRSQRPEDFDHYFSHAIAKSDWQAVELDVTESSDAFLVKTTTTQVRITKAPFRLSVSTPDGRSLYSDSPGTQVRADGAVRLSLKMASDEVCYGLGEHAETLNLRGKRFAIWNAESPNPYVRGDNPLYYNIPFYLGVHDAGVYGIFWDNTYRGAVDLGAETTEQLTFEAEGGHLSYYVFAGQDVNRVISHYTELTGRIQLPPMWFLGFHQCRWSYAPQDTVLTLAKEFRDRGIPCDAIYLDIDYLDGYRVFTRNQAAFPDFEGMIDNLHGQGFKVVSIIDPGIKVDPDFTTYQSGLEQDVFLKYPDGQLAAGAVWPGLCHFPDFMNPRTRSWWAEQCRSLLEAGIDGLWNDMCEPTVFLPEVSDTLPDFVVHYNEGQDSSHLANHNLYGMQMARATHEALEKYNAPEKRPVNITRAGFAGTQRYASSWTGDNISNWDHLRLSISMSLNMGLSGAPMTGPDIGGFGGDSDGELFARWLQAACLFPYFRSHTSRGTAAQEPWAFGQPYEVINRMTIQLRYRLLPYLYSVVAQSAEYGWPVIRPLFMAEPDNPNLRSVDDSYLLGDGLLVAPVLEQGAVGRSVYLPGTDDWYDYWTNERFSSGQVIDVTAPLERLPLFVREGVVLPLWPEMRHVGEQPIDTLTLRLYPGNHETTLYEDDGQSKAYREGAYHWLYFTAMEEDDLITVARRPAGSFEPGYTSINLEVVALDDEPLEVKVDRRGAPIWFYDDGILEVSAGLFRSVEITRKSSTSDRTLLSRPW